MPGPRRRRAVPAAALSVLLLTGGLLGTAQPPTAAAAQVCDQPPATDAVLPDVPWAQRGWDPEVEVWPFSTGAGVTVAVLDTGVQTSNPQLQGRVAAGIDLVGSGPADVDCVPHGSGLAGVVVAGPLAGVGLRGLAPDALVLPVQVVERPAADLDDEPADPARLAAGVLAAVSAGAAVVLVGPVVFADDPALADAVGQALAAGVVVVAGVGDGHDAERDGEGPTSSLATPYPAAYPGVIGVAAVGTDGLRPATSQLGDYVDLAAPGVDVVSTGTTAQQVYQGTAFAAASVAATAALLVAAPGLVPTGPDRPAAVLARLAATALPPPAAVGYGAGTLSPGRALTEAPSSAAPLAVPGYQVPPRDEAAEADAAAAAVASTRSTWWAVGGGALTVLVVLAGVLLPRRVGDGGGPVSRPRRARTRNRQASSPSSALFERPGAGDVEGRRERAAPARAGAARSR